MTENKTPATMRLMEEAAKHYGGGCLQCGVKDVRVLTIYPSHPRGLLQQLYHLQARNWPQWSEGGEPYRLICRNCEAIREDLTSK